MSKFKIDSNIPSVGLNLTSDPFAQKEGEYSFLLNGALHGLEGKSPFVRMFPGTKLMDKLPAGFFPIGSVAVNHREICLFSINPAYNDSQIGLFDGNTYRIVTSSTKLGFDIRKQIQAVIDEDFNGHTLVTWIQQGKPIRAMDLNEPPQLNGELDIDALNVFKTYSYPQASVTEVVNNGRLLSASYYVCTQYADENGNGLSGYSTPIGPFYIYRDAISQPRNFMNGSPDREITSKALRIQVDNLDLSFKYYNIAIVKSFAGIREAYIVQTLPTVQSSYLYTGIKVSERAIDLKDISVPAVSYSSGKTIARSGGSTLIGNLQGRKEYNLQPHISKIQLQWQMVKEKYDTSDKTSANPLNGAYKMSLRRNEVNAFGIAIRWNDGTLSRVYPLIARKKNIASDGAVVPVTMDIYNRAIDTGAWDSFTYGTSNDIYEQGAIPERWKYTNTAYITGTDLSGIEGPAEYGEFGYWESTDRYPNNIKIYGEDAGQPIRHFMAPDPAIAPITDGKNAFKTDKDDIYINRLAVRFPNIEQIMNELPAEIKEQMEGWEFVRADRRNNKSVIASGLIYNMRYQNWKTAATGYTPILGAPIPVTGSEDDIRLFQNYPLNDLRPDNLISKYGGGASDQYRKDVFSFTSPDTEFDKTMLLNGELQVHYESYGVAKDMAVMLEPYPNMKFNTQDDEYRKLFYHMAAIGYYNNWKLTAPGMLRRELKESIYIPFNAQVAGGNVGLPVHNLMQQHTVMLQTGKELSDPTTTDTSRAQVSDPDFACKVPADPRYRTASSYYVSIVSRLENQYGGVYDTRYIGTNMNSSNIRNNIPVFAGDTFVGLYGTKRQLTMYQNAQAYISFPDGSRGVDLKNSVTIPGTNYYYTSVPKWIADNSNSECEPNGTGTSLIPMIETGIPFFVTESDHNIDLQLNGEGPGETFFPNLKDGSLSLHKWAGIQYIDQPNEHLVNRAYEEVNDLYGYLNPDPYFNPDKIMETHYSTRVIFSLTNSAENRFNNITVFSPLNYYDFRRDCGELWDIRDLGNNRILFRLEHGLYMDQKYATIPVEGNKIQLGTGKLFENEPLHIVKTDSGYLGTHAQWAFNSTPFGSFFIDPLRNAVVQYGESANDIAANGADKFFNDHLSLHILKDFPAFRDFDNAANPEGVGYSSVWDDLNKMWLLTKRDVSLIDKGNINNFRYDIDGALLLNNRKVSLSDRSIFADASFTFAYSPLTQKWISWMSFMPGIYTVLQKDYFSFADGGIWQHNKGLPRTFYGKRHPFIFEGITKYDQGESMIHSCSWVTRAFEIKNNIQQGETFLETFNKGCFYNEQQSTGEVLLTIQDENKLSTLFRKEQVTDTFIERFLRRRERFWQVAELYDFVRDHNLPMFQQNPESLQANYFIDKIVNKANMEYDRSFDQAAPLNDLWMKYRLSYDNDKDIQLYLYIVGLLNEPVIT